MVNTEGWLLGFRRHAGFNPIGGVCVFEGFEGPVFAQIAHQARGMKVLRPD
jgi:hypothetical protein